MNYLNKFEIVLLFILCIFLYSNKLEAQYLKKDSFPDSLMTVKDTLGTMNGLNALKELELKRKHEIAFYDSISCQLKSELKNAKTRKKKGKLIRDIKVYSQKKQIVEKVYLINKKGLMTKYQLLLNDSVPNPPDSSDK